MTGPREEWHGRYQVNQEADRDGGVLYLYAVCQPSCRALSTPAGAFNLARQTLMVHVPTTWRPTCWCI